MASQSSDCQNLFDVYNATLMFAQNFIYDPPEIYLKCNNFLVASVSIVLLEKQWNFIYE